MNESTLLIITVVTFVTLGGYWAALHVGYRAGRREALDEVSECYRERPIATHEFLSGHRATLPQVRSTEIKITTH